MPQPTSDLTYTPDSGHDAGSPATFDELLKRIESVRSRAEEEGSPLGYFAALYESVASLLEKHRQTGIYEDPELVLRIELDFGYRYLEGLQSAMPPKCWAVAREAASSSRLAVLQHVLLGVNAHINFDISQTLATILEPDQFPGFANDFRRVGDALKTESKHLLRGLTRISPILGSLNRLFSFWDESKLAHQIDKARSLAWDSGLRLARTPLEDRPKLIAALEQESVRLAGRILWPGLLGGIVLLLVRIDERGSVRSKIGKLRAELA